MGDPLPDDRLGPPWLGLFIGTVSDVADPLSLGRVMVCCPEISGKTTLPDWSWPLGTVGGGNPQRGIFAVPAVGSSVGILFASGNLDNSFYLPGWFAEPDSGKETPDPGVTDTPGNPTLVMWETAKWKIILSTDNNKLRIESKDTPAFIEIDGATQEMTLSTTDLKLGGAGAAQALVLGTAFLALFNSHTHAGVTVGAGVTGPPAPLMVAGTHTSTVSKTL